jgi:tocopherol O-methyltransferase
MSQLQRESLLTADIRRHYDALSGFYELLWGPHIHHGYWEDGETPAEAQVKLIERLAARLHIARDHRVLDIGSGLGGSTCWLAKTFGCSALGLTLSPVQVQAARKRAVREGVDNLVSFRAHDANRLDLPSETFDRIWIIECSEHIHDKQTFFKDCARLLRPGGQLGLCVWLRGNSGDPAHQGLVREICAAMLCPSLLTRAEQVSALRTAGFHQIEVDDVTANVAPTWQHCGRLVSNPLVRLIVHAKAGKLRRFVDSFGLMEKGYREGATAYGMITAVKQAL